MNTKKMKWICNLLLLLTAAIWGFAFVAQSVSMDYVGPFTFAFVRFMIGGFVLLPVIWFMDRSKMKKKAVDVNAANPAVSNVLTTKEDWRLSIKAGLFCGTALCAASIMQQYGIIYTTVGKAGFITTLYIILVPFLGLVLGKKITGKIWIGAVIAVAGLYLICMTESFTIGTGDIFVLVCAFLFAIQIMFVDYFSPKSDPVKISCVQFFTASAISFIFAMILEEIAWADLVAAVVPILYVGILSTAVAYTLQVVAQRYTDPTVASLIMSLESVIATLAGWLLLNESLSSRELFGCGLMFIAIILVQLPDRKAKTEA